MSPESRSLGPGSMKTSLLLQKARSSVESRCQVDLLGRGGTHLERWLQGYWGSPEGNFGQIRKMRPSINPFTAV